MLSLFITLVIWAQNTDLLQPQMDSHWKIISKKKYPTHHVHIPTYMLNGKISSYNRLCSLWIDIDIFDFLVILDAGKINFLSMCTLRLIISIDHKYWNQFHNETKHNSASIDISKAVIRKLKKNSIFAQSHHLVIPFSSHVHEWSWILAWK